MASRQITWSFAENISLKGIQFLGAMTARDQDRVQRAFETWEKIVDIDFVEVAQGMPAQIRIGLSTIAGNPWGYATGKLTDGVIQLDPAKYQGSALRPLAIHEIGHLLGISHSESLADIMYPSFEVRNVSYSDIDAAIRLQGAKVPAIDNGNNFFVATRGNDTLDAGGGRDTVLYGSQSGTVKIQRNGDHLTVTGNGIDAYANVERLEFQDATIAFDLSGTAGQAYRVYQAAFARSPDTGGLGYWIRFMDSGAGLTDVANGFIGSAEFISVYGSNVSNADFVQRLYRNVLGREGEAGGSSYWTGQLNAGASKAAVLAGFSESAENIAGVAPAISDGIWYQ